MPLHLYTLSLLFTLSHHHTLRYVDDLPAVEGELYAGLVLSEHAHASITVDASAALVMEGVVDYVCVSDVPGSNMVGEYLSEIVFHVRHVRFACHRRVLLQVRNAFFKVRNIAQLHSLVAYHAYTHS